MSCVFVLVQSKINWDISKASEQLGLNVLGFFYPFSIKLNCKLNKWKPNDLNVEVSCFLLMYLNQTHLLIQLQCIVFVRSESWIWILECLKQKKIFLKMSGQSYLRDTQLFTSTLHALLINVHVLFHMLFVIIEALIK